MTQNEHPAGWVVDLACLRRYPTGEYLDRARTHSTDCALMGHCVESGYGLVQDDNTVIPLDTAATRQIVAVLSETGDRQGIRLVVHREQRDSEMVTSGVERDQ